MTDTDFVEVYRARDDLQAQLVVSALESAGIASKVIGDSIGALYPNFWWAAPRILVSGADAARAASILRDFDTHREPQKS